MKGLQQKKLQMGGTKNKAMKLTVIINSQDQG